VTTTTVFQPSVCAFKQGARDETSCPAGVLCLPSALSVLYNLEFIRPALQDPPGEEESKSIPDNQRERFFIIHRTYRVWEYSWWVLVLILRLLRTLGAPPSASHELAHVVTVGMLSVEPVSPLHALRCPLPPGPTCKP
jgi:hypothetical protein